MNTLIRVLKENPDLVERFMEAGSFYTTYHDVCFCPDGNCEDCYSGDTECGNERKLIEVVKELFRKIPVSNNEFDSDDAEISEIDT